MKNGSNYLYLKYRDRLYSFISSRAKDPNITDDIMQNIFLKIHTKIDTLKDHEKIESWIYQITRNAIIDYYRTNKKLDELPDSYTEPVPDSDPKEREEISSWLRPMIENLPDKYRETLLLSEIKGMSQKEIAKKTGLSLSGTKSRIQRGRGLVKKNTIKMLSF